MDRWINVPLESLKLSLQCCTCLYISSHLGTGLIQVMGHGIFMMPKGQRNEVIKCTTVSTLEFQLSSSLGAEKVLR